ncbi:hypothetical protein EW093_09170 [Thiospirochaeta perfilievii]|uniref:VanZ-like domain-containing protein n=1 Tax=Thiospirochaeta perfilievii TaxID=252967 RepID=A0A5C1QBH6_9SPIO|nr:VanZ family protein [Thiospirochaeta perfilievii]QEN04867.1 hypothetical protein EW093_09170 [Thiospirochaeta perfilievii]
MKKTLRLIPLFILYIAILYLSLKTPSGKPPIINNIDKLYHFIAYGTLGFTICFSILNKRISYVILVFSLIFGLTIEYIQGTLPYRDMSIADGISNTLGLISGTILYKRLEGLLRKYLSFIY